MPNASQKSLRLAVTGLSLTALVLVGCSSNAPGAAGLQSAKYVPPVRQTNFVRAGQAASSDQGATYAGGRTASGAGMAATSQMPVDLPTVMRLASGRNLDVSLVREELRESHFEMVNANWWLLPNIRPSVRFQDLNGNAQNTPGRILDVDKNNTFAGAGIYVDWEVGDSIFEQLAAKQRRNASTMASKASINDATLAASETYFDLLRAQTALVIAEDTVSLYKDLVSETESQVAAGGGFRGDVLRARARLSHAGVVQREADGDRRIAAARLREILNLPSTVELFAAEGTPARMDLVGNEEPEDSLVRRAIAGRPELREAQYLARAAYENRRKTTVGPYIPNVRAGYEAGGYGNNFGTLGRREEVGVSLDWTIGRDGIGGKPRQQAAAARLRQAQLKTEKVEQRIVREVSSAYAAMQTRSEAIDVAEGGVKDSKEALDLYRQRQQIGVGIPLDVIVAQETFTAAQLDFLDAVIGYNKAQMRLLRALGVTPSK